MIWNIVTDSSCDLKRLLPAEENIRYCSVPFVITVGAKDYVDDDGICVEDMVDAMEQEKHASSTACPAPGAWLDAFSAEGNVIAITISKNLSGSYSSACAARDMLLESDPEKKIAVINSASAGSALVLLLRRICKDIHSGLDFDRIVDRAEQDVADSRTVFALCSFDNLVKNGRMPRVVGFVARRLGLWGIGIATPQGTLSVKGKARGKAKALTAIVEDMKERRVPTDSVVISHCQNEAMAEALKAKILELWSNVTVELHPTKGLCSYYAERHGLIITYY